MHQSPQKLPGGCREKRAVAAVAVDEDDDRQRAPRLTPPKARRYLQRDETPRERSRSESRS
jgi:hypothetical protein